MFVGLRTRAICRRGAAPRRRHPRARQRARPRLEDAREATMVHAGRHARVQPVGGVRGHRDRTRARWLVELLPRLQAVGAWHAACTGTHGVVLYALNTRVFVSHVQTVLYARIAAHLTPNENLAAHKNCSENYCPPWTVHGGQSGGRFCCASLPSAPRSSPGAEASACRAIEADLGAISPGRAAAGGGHGGLAEGERAFCTFMCD